MVSIFDRYKLATVRDCEDMLIEHLDDKRVPMAWAPAHTRRRFISNLLRFHQLIVEDGAYTVMTDDGRKALCELLGHHADQLMTAYLSSVDAIHYSPYSQPYGKKEQADARAATIKLGAAILDSRQGGAVADRADTPVPA